MAAYSPLPTSPLHDGVAPQPTNERMVYLVPSDRNPKVKYRVDLTAEGGYSRCACTDWNTRRWPNIKAGQAAGTRECACKHVLKVRHHFLNALLKDMAKGEESPR